MRNIRSGLFCENYPVFKDRQIAQIKREFPAWLGALHSRRDEGGLGYVHEALHWLELPGTRRLVKPPRLQVFDSFRNLIRTLPALPYDDLRVEDVDTNVEDHAYDALRYGLALERQQRSTPRAVQMIWGK